MAHFKLKKYNNNKYKENRWNEFLWNEQQQQQQVVVVQIEATQDGQRWEKSIGGGVSQENQNWFDDLSTSWRRWADLRHFPEYAVSKNFFTTFYEIIYFRVDCKPF